MFYVGLFVCLFLWFSFFQYDYSTMLVKTKLRHTMLCHRIWGWHFCWGRNCFFFYSSYDVGLVTPLCIYTRPLSLF